MNMKENPAVIEQTTKAPTALHLFGYKGPELTALKTKVSAARILGENLTKTDASLNKLTAESEIRIDRLMQSLKELMEQSGNTSSSVTCGIVFLKMREELQDLSPKDFMEFFRQCLTYNTKLEEEYRKSKSTYGENNSTLDYQTIILLKNQRANLRENSSSERVKDPPTWFKGDKDEWEFFAYTHGTFMYYLNPDLLKSRMYSRSGILKKLRESSIIDSHTINGEFPDWLLEDSDIMPDVKTVEEELEEDKGQMEKLQEAFDKIKKQANYLANTVDQKVQNSVSRISEIIVQVFPSTLTFSDLILFLELTGKKLSSLPIDEKAAEETVLRYVNSRTLLTDHEPLALYLEKKLREGGLIKTSQDRIDTNFIDFVSSALRHTKAQKDTDGQENSFQNLKTTAKKAYGALNYDIKPFLEVLPTDDLSLLEDLLKESNDKPVELFIWDMANSISSAFKNKKREDLTRSQLSAIVYLAKFTNSFLKARSAWAFDQIQKSIVGEDQEANFDSDEQPTSQIQQEIETTTEEIAQGNLAGWQFLYSINRTSNPEHLVKIESQTTEEFEQNLSSFIAEQKLSCSIPASSIVNAFEWLITNVPKEAEQIRMGMEINGEYFKKLRRQRVRLLYQMDPAKKQFIFFIHQKQAWKYGF